MPNPETILTVYNGTVLVENQQYIVCENIGTKTTSLLILNK